MLYFIHFTFVFLKLSVCIVSLGFIMFISVRDSHPSKIRLSRLFPDILIEVNLEHPVKSTEVKLELTTSIV
nr:MAG TPA: hypothetical protein [Caudoviricetes sp.]